MLRIGPGKTSTKPAQGLSGLILKLIPFLKETSGHTPGVSILSQHNAANALITAPHRTLGVNRL